MSDLTDYDIEVLRCIAGEDVPGLAFGDRPWVVTARVERVERVEERK